MIPFERYGGSHSLKPVIFHLLKEILCDGVSGGLANNGIDAAVGAEGGTLRLQPVKDLLGVKDGQAVEAAADRILG